jgi:hypothetical protein
MPLTPQEISRDLRSYAKRIFKLSARDIDDYLLSRSLPL